MNWKKTVLICALILCVGIGITTVVFLTEPTAQREGATRQTAMLVSVTTVDRDTYRPEIAVMGTVQPAQEIELSPRVSGEIVERASAFTPGGRIEKGELLLRIDPADYEIALRQSKTDLMEAQADLALEQGRQNVARQDFELLDEQIATENRSLVLREPQLETARARVEAAKARLERAELNLERTRIRAPFDALVLSRNVNIGSQVAPGDVLGHLVGTDAYWVITTVPLSKLRFIDIPMRPGEAGSSVQVRNRTAWPEGKWREGVIEQMVGELDMQTRLARVLVTIHDPLADTDAPPLMIGAFVEVMIEGMPIEDVVRIDRDHVRSNATAWVMKEGKLEIRDLEIVFQDARYAYVRSGLEEGEQVITSSLATVTEGAALRTESGDDEEDPE